MTISFHKNPVLKLFLERIIQWMSSSLLECSLLHFSCSENFPVLLRTSDDMWSRKNMKRYWQLASKYLLHIGKISQSFRVRSFGLIPIRISHPRSLGSWCIRQATDDWSILGKDSSVPLMHRIHMWSEWSRINSPNHPILILVIIMFLSVYKCITKPNNLKKIE